MKRYLITDNGEAKRNRKNSCKEGNIGIEKRTEHRTLKQAKVENEQNHVVETNRKHISSGLLDLKRPQKTYMQKNVLKGSCNEEKERCTTSNESVLSNSQQHKIQMMRDKVEAHNWDIGFEN